MVSGLRVFLKRKKCLLCQGALGGGRESQGDSGHPVSSPVLVSKMDGLTGGPSIAGVHRSTRSSLKSELRVGGVQLVRPGVSILTFIL